VFRTRLAALNTIIIFSFLVINLLIVKRVTDKAGQSEMKT